jgi:hypothetical protein
MAPVASRPAGGCDDLMLSRETRKYLQNRNRRAYAISPLNLRSSRLWFSFDRDFHFSAGLEAYLLAVFIV